MQQAITKGKDTAELKLTFSDGKWRMAKGMENAMGKVEYPQLEVKESKEGQFTFKIEHPSEMTFADEPFAPMPGANNPSDFHEQFYLSKKEAKKIVVEVRNANPKDPTADYAGGVYVYELRFKGAPPLDPIITNGGCCKTLASPDGNMSLVAESGAIHALALAALLIFLGAARLRWARP